MALLHTDVYPDYYETYISKVEEPDLLLALLKNRADTESLYRSIAPEKEEYRYADGKWTIKEVLQHIMDTERVMTYRALRFARKDQTPLPGFDQDVFAAEYHLDGINLDQMMEEFISIRNSTILLFRHLTEDQLHHIGTASGWKMSVNALFHVVVGHAEHHNRIIKDQYLGN